MKYHLNGKVAAYDKRRKKYYVCKNAAWGESRRDHYGTGSAEEQIRYYFETFAALRERSFDLAIEHIAILTAGRRVSVLDIGSSYGLFLKKIREQGWTGVGIEPSKHEAHFSREEFKLDVFETTIEDFTPDREFDVITLWDVFEHLPNASTVLKQLRAMLSHDGILIIRVPNARGLVHRLSFMAYIGTLGMFRFPLAKLFENHEYIYTEYALAETLKASGFQKLQSYGESIIPPDVAIIRKKSYLAWMPNPFQVVISHSVVTLLKAAAALSMQDSIVVYFRKNA